MKESRTLIVNEELLYYRNILESNLQTGKT